MTIYAETILQIYSSKKFSKATTQHSNLHIVWDADAILKTSMNSFKLNWTNLTHRLHPVSAKDIFWDFTNRILL